MRTLLPTPYAPMMKNTEPVGTSNDTSWRTVFGPNDLMMFLNWIIAGDVEEDATLPSSRRIASAGFEDDSSRRREAIAAAVAEDPFP